MPDFTRKRILLVDDNEDHLFLTKVRLEHEDEYLDVEVATSAEEALEKLKSTHFDCVVSDIDMQPGMNGLELLDNLRSLSPDMPTVLMSGNEDVVASLPNPDKPNGFVPKTGGADFIQKMAHSIRQAMVKHSSSSQKAMLFESVQLRLERDRYRSFFDLAREVGILLGKDGQTIAEINNAALELFDNDSTVRGTSLMRHIIPEDRTRLRIMLRDALTDGFGEEIVRLQSPSGAISTVLLRAIVLREGRAAHTLIMCGEKAEE